MKRFFAPLFALSILFAPIIAAEEAPPPPRYLNIFTAHVKIGHGPQYEAAVKDLWKAMKEAGGTFPLFAFQSVSSPGDYSFITAQQSMADLDMENETFNKLFATAGDVLAELSKHSKGNESQIIAPRPDLSYVAAEPRLKDDEGTFAYIVYLYPHPEHVQDVAAGITSFTALNTKLGIQDGYGVFQNVTGEGPMFAIRTLAKSQADYFAQAEKNDAKLGEAGIAIRTKVGLMLSRIEYSSGISRPDLSYQP